MIAKEKKQAIIKEFGRTEGWTEKRTSCIPQESRYREIPCSDRETWSEKIIRFSKKEDQLTDQKLHLMMWFLVCFFLSEFLVLFVLFWENYLLLIMEYDII